jgi:hypothetical protein
MPDSSDRSRHPREVDLIRFADGEMEERFATSTQHHLRICDECRRRLEQLKAGVDAYDQYHSQILKPALELPPNWSGLQTRLTALDQTRRSFYLPPFARWATVALSCCAAVVCWLIYQGTPAREMQRILARAEAASAAPHRRLQVIAGGQRWYRPARLQERTPEYRPEQRSFDATRELFVKANYSWDDPLSARSFATWRGKLPDRRDQVASISDGNSRFYRVQTETTTGVLRAAALTLRADTLIAVQGTFRFEQQYEVRIEEAGDLPSVPAEPRTTPGQLADVVPVAPKVGAEEELRVLAALDAIGADVNEQVAVDIDPSKHQLLIRGSGLSEDRQRQIREALAAFPNAALQFASGQPAVAGKQSANPHFNSDDSAPLRRTLEEQAGGAQRFQELTDQALDASSTILAQAHILNKLSQEFPSSVSAGFGPKEQETLLAMRRRHAVAITQAAIELKRSLGAILGQPIPEAETASQGAASWEVGAAELYERAKALDSSLGRILAGTYSREVGETIWKRLPNDVQELEALAGSQEKAR